MRVSKPFTKPSKGFNWASISFQRASIDFKKFQFLTRIRHFSRTYGRTGAKKSRPPETAPLDLMGRRRDVGFHGRNGCHDGSSLLLVPPGQGPGVRARSVSPLRNTVAHNSDKCNSLAHSLRQSRGTRSFSRVNLNAACFKQKRPRNRFQFLDFLEEPWSGRRDSYPRPQPWLSQ